MVISQSLHYVHVRLAFYDNFQNLLKAMKVRKNEFSTIYPSLHAFQSGEIIVLSFVQQ